MSTMIMCKRELAPNIRFLLWIFMLTAYYGLLQNPVMRRVVLTLSLYVSYLLLLSISLLTLLSIIFPSCKVNRGNHYHTTLIHYCSEFLHLSLLY